MKIEKVTVRNFRANLASYLERIKSGEVFEVGGVPIGVCTQLMNLAIELKKSECTRPILEKVQVAALRCDNCLKNKSSIYRRWEDGEERDVCEDCLKSKFGKLWKKFGGQKNI